MMKPWYEQAVELLEKASYCLGERSYQEIASANAQLAAQSPTLLRAALEERKALKARLDRVQELELDALRERDWYRAKVEPLQSERDALAAENAALRNECHGADVRYDALNDRLGENIEAAENTIRQINAQNFSLKQRADALAARVAYLEALCNTHEAEVATTYHGAKELGAQAGYATAEREIVEWLRSQAEDYYGPGDPYEQRQIADQIAAGAHRKPEGECTHPDYEGFVCRVCGDTP